MKRKERKRKRKKMNNINLVGRIVQDLDLKKS